MNHLTATQSPFKKSPFKSRCTHCGIDRRGQAGYVLVVVLVALAIASTVSLTMMQMALRQRRQMKREAAAVQVNWMLRSGLRYALADRQRADFVWDVRDDLIGVETAMIQATWRDRDDANQTSVTVHAQLQFATASDPPLSRTRTIRVNPSQFP